MKPKCELCLQKGDDLVYFWIEERGGGKLVHFACAKVQEELFEKVRRGLDRMIDNLNKGRQIL